LAAKLSSFTFAHAMASRRTKYLTPLKTCEPNTIATCARELHRDAAPSRGVSGQFRLLGDTTMKTETYEPANLKLWSHPENYIGECWPATYSTGVGQSRDSDALERSNFRTMLDAIGGESETVTVVRESHWAVGWVEWIAIHQDDAKALKIADEQVERLAEYPVLDDDDFSETEQQDANETWQNCFSSEERIRYIRKHKSQFEFHDYADMLSCVRGKYFAGYASELLN
jgi:hypothetical protein